MPPLPAVPNVVKVITKFAAETLLPVIVNHFLYSGGPPSNADCTALATAWYTAFSTNFAPFYPASFTFTEVDVIDLSSIMGSGGTAAGSAPGSDASAALPGQCCMLLHKSIQRRYRGGHPRTYLPGFSTDHMLNDKQWNTASALAAGTNWQATVGALVGGGPFGTTRITSEVNVSYRTAHALRPVPVVDPILTVVGEMNMATQRRRLSRAG